MKKRQNNLIYNAINTLLISYNKVCFQVSSIYQKLVGTSVYVRLLRLNNPTGLLLLLMPTWWAIAFASSGIIQIVWLCFLFGFGALVMRSAGCIINDIIDYKLDQLVSRTKNRPLARGELSKKEALLVLIMLLSIAFLILMALPETSIKIGLFAVIPIAIYPIIMLPITAYPFAKRFTFFPQIVLGLTFNLGVLMAWVSAASSWSWHALLLYIAAALWTIGYDTIYAYQDIKDDIQIGVKSMAIKLGDNGPIVIWVLYQITLILLCIAGLNMHMNAWFYAIIALSGYHLYWQIETIDIDDPEDCAYKFRSNIEFAFLVFLGILIGKI